MFLQFKFFNRHYELLLKLDFNLITLKKLLSQNKTPKTTFFFNFIEHFIEK